MSSHPPCDSLIGITSTIIHGDVVAEAAKLKQIGVAVGNAGHPQEVQRFAERVLFFDFGHEERIAQRDSGVHPRRTIEQNIWTTSH